MINIYSYSLFYNLVKNFCVSLPYVSGSNQTKFASYQKFPGIMLVLIGFTTLTARMFPLILTYEHQDVNF